MAAGGLTESRQVRNERYRITVNCFDSLVGLGFKGMLKQYQISTVTDIESLHPMGQDWDRRFVSSSEQ